MDEWSDVPGTDQIENFQMEWNLNRIVPNRWSEAIYRIEYESSFAI